MKRFVFFIALLVCSIAVLSGCTRASKKDTMSGNKSLLEPQSMVKFNDIPVPAGFKFESTESYAFESTGVRVGFLKYKGRGDIERVVNFYKDQMPLYNWNLLNVVEYGERLLNFDREQETCIVTLLAKGKNITITISLGPKSAARSRKAEKPVK
ncbi:MAG: hypothetical protein ABH806_03435 [Candidatus Omnitrophota bacterium]